MRLALQAGHTTENGQCNALNLNPPGSSHQCVRKLVHKNRDQKQHGSNGRRDPPERRAPIRVLVWKQAHSQAQGYQEKDDKQAPIQIDIYACNANEPKSTAHLDSLAVCELTREPAQVLFFLRNDVDLRFHTFKLRLRTP